MDRFGRDLSDKTFCIWGLSFEPGTDDMRDASLVLMKTLIKAGARIKAYDPVAMDQALENTDACVLVTEWKAFRQPDFIKIKLLMDEPVIFDGRNQYSPEEIGEAGFEYHGLGREPEQTPDI